LRTSLDRLRKEYERVKHLKPDEIGRAAIPSPAKLTDKLAARTESVISALDDQGRWVEHRRHGNPAWRDMIRSVTFIRNVNTLSDYVEATRLNKD
ncbi:MAG: hypothetical protein JW818_23370, partial [Pirellulales bacterium]|nr:hypothetical protein [Pirellulales bacterium]